ASAPTLRRRQRFPNLRRNGGVMSQMDRRKFLQLTGMAAIATSSLNANIAKAAAIKANNTTGTIRDVEHIVILMQENRPFDHHFGTLRGVRGYADPRAVEIHLALRAEAPRPRRSFCNRPGRRSP